LQEFADIVNSTSLYTRLPQSGAPLSERTSSGHKKARLYVSMGKMAKKRIKDRGFVSYFPKLAKKADAAARADVHSELEKMLSFVLKGVTDAGATIMGEYDTKSDTVRPKLMQAALMTLLHGDLKSSAMQAGAEAVASKFKKSKKAGEAEKAGELVD